MKRLSLPECGLPIHVEITHTGGTVFREFVPEAVLKLDHCVLELSERSAVRFAFFQNGVVECAGGPEPRTFAVSDGCLSMRDNALTLICRCAQPCECAPCECGNGEENQ